MIEAAQTVALFAYGTLQLPSVQRAAFAADAYEVDDMKRIEVKLASGKRAFVYVNANT